MRLTLGLLLLMVGLSACQAYSPTPKPLTNTRIADKSKPYWTHHNEGEIYLSIVVPEGWETYNTPAGIVLNEQSSASGPDQPLQGFLIHIFIPYMDDFRIPASNDTNMAWAILKQVVTNPDYVGNARVSEPVAFVWDQHDAAYYLLNNLDNTVTMLLAIGLPDQQTLVVCHVSAPEDQSARIRPMLPELLSTLKINNATVNAEALRQLPEPLEFPSSRED